LEALSLNHPRVVTEQSITTVGAGEVEATLGVDLDDILVDKAACRLTPTVSHALRCREMGRSGEAGLESRRYEMGAAGNTHLMGRLCDLGYHSNRRPHVGLEIV